MEASAELQGPYAPGVPGGRMWVNVRDEQASLERHGYAMQGKDRKTCRATPPAPAAGGYRSGRV